MLTFTDQAGSVISLMTQLAPGAEGVRLSTSIDSDHGRSAPPALRISMAYEFSAQDELVLTPSGVPVFIDQEIAPVLQGTTLDGSIDSHGRPRFTACREEQARDIRAWRDPFEL